MHLDPWDGFVCKLDFRARILSDFIFILPFRQVYLRPVQWKIVCT